MPNAPKKSGARPPPVLDRELPGPQHRQFPRARMPVLFRLWMGEGDERKFQASLSSHNVSVSGVFLESTFFMPMGTQLSLSFELDPEEDPVLARGEIVRQESPNARGEGRSGFALRFIEFFQQSEVTLAKLFLGEKLRDFAESYLGSKRARSLNNELDRCVDALAAWELKKVTSPNDAWDLQGSSLEPVDAKPSRSSRSP